MSESKSGTTREQTFLQAVYDYYRREGAWPLTRRLRVEQWDNKPEILATALGRSLVLWQDSSSSDARCRLRLQAIARCEGSDGDIEAYLRLIHWAAARFAEAVGDVTIDTDEIAKALDIDLSQAVRVTGIFHDEGRFWSSGSGPDTDGKYSFTLRESLLYVGKAKSLDEYRAGIEEQDADGRKLADLNYRDWDLAERVDELGTSISDLTLPEAAADAAENEAVRSILRQDLRELNTALRSGAWKSVGILSGSCCECILLDRWLVRPEAAVKAFGKKWPHGVSLTELAKKSQAAGFLTEESGELVAILRRWRNLVHPARALRNTTPRRETALMLVAVLQVLLAELGHAGEEDTKGHDS